MRKNLTLLIKRNISFLSTEDDSTFSSTSFIDGFPHKKHPFYTTIGRFLGTKWEFPILY
jgi:hypothetical protein